MIKIENWSSYQSYKDRKPPWIRFHKSMLDNFDYHIMSADARALLPMLWLLASEDKDPVSGLLRDSYKKITFRLRMEEKIFLSALEEIIKGGFVTLVNSPCNESVTKFREDVTPEAEAEAENKDGEDVREEDNKLKFKVPEGIDKNIWKEYEEMRNKIRKPMTEKARVLAVAELIKINKATGDDPNTVLEQSIFNAWQGLFKLKKENGNGGKTREYNKSNISKIEQSIDKLARKYGVTDY